MQGNQEWDIKSRAETCVLCGTLFVERQPFLSLLLHEQEGYVRRDFCEACWGKAAESSGDNSGAARPNSRISSWKSIFRLPPPPRPEPVKKETAETLLRGLMAGNQATNKNMIFVLAVMLERRRVLVERAVQKEADGRIIRVYEHRQSGETLLITDPELDLGALEEVQKETLALLSGSATPQNTAQPAVNAAPANDDAAASATATTADSEPQEV